MSSLKQEKFSLKDELFNPKKVKKIADEIKEGYPSFELEKFTDEVLNEFPKLELKERIYHIRDRLHNYLPSNYQEAVTILLQALPPELDPTKSDDDFGDFIYAPYSEYITTYGCSSEHLAFSLEALLAITKRFSVEFAIRDFINHYPKETLAMLVLYAKSDNYHERRLASEGLRPKLPWAKKLTIDYKLPLEHLELLYADKTRYVTRSVANHLNDIAKIDAPLVIATLKRWKESEKQEPKEMEFMVNHALRTLVKKGDVEALVLLGYEQNPPIEVAEIELKSSSVKVGEALEFAFTINATKSTKLMVDYVVHFCTKNGKLSPKVHKLKKLEMKKGEEIVLKKKHLFRANMTTRTFYGGEHWLEVQVNGVVLGREKFELKG